MKNCRLVGLLDLDQGSSYVRGKMKEYLEELIDIGVAGFRFDASKHMWPQDLQALLDSLKNLKADVAFFITFYDIINSLSHIGIGTCTFIALHTRNLG